MFDGTSGLIRDGVYDQIRVHILSCELAPGTRIHENDLAARFNVSKSPVRDALLRLQEQGLIEVLPRKGYRVRPISVTDVRELYEMRLIYEKATIHRAIAEASNQELAGLDKYRSAGAGPQLVDWVRYNRDFHRAIAEMAGNARLAKSAAEVIDQFDRLTFLGVSNVTDGAAADKLVDEHCALIDAIQARDKGLAGRLITDHIKRSRKRVFQVLDNPQIVE
ncbi:MAG: GntR family transcriptional regulator [Rhodospirillales bacterium]|nr:GntR family transcriptional regulator [Rhodospirillales bacterium]